MSDITSLIRKQKALKERILFREMNVKFHKFGDINFYDGMSFIEMGDGELILSHAYFHKSYTMDKPNLTHMVLEKLHMKMVKELLNRGLPHVNFDKLDGI